MASTSSSSSPPSPQWKYDVFLSFRGEDTRKNFVGHLHTALHHKGIITFKDDRELERGKPISPELVKAIQDSRFSVIIFSRTYASSTWCLDELATIFECMQQGRQTVLPIFYDVEPSEVRKQTGAFGKAFAKHEDDFGENNIHKLERWRSAMTEVASVSGWDIRHRDESEFIQDFVEEVLSELRKSWNKFLTVENDLVGMDSHLEKMSLYLRIEQLNDVRIIGIWGMGGIGKTTIARVVYEKMSYRFEGSSFISNVRETYEKHGLIPLQEQLISETMRERGLKIWDVCRGEEEIRNRLCFRRVLVVLDDTDQLVQLKSLVGNRNCIWLGSGSRVIVTTRDEHLLKQYKVDETYRVEELDPDKALQLFSFKAFKTNSPPEKYVQLSNHFVEYAGGLPLALDVLGSFLCEKSVEEWKSALNRLKEIPEDGILAKLQISFDGLKEIEKTIFLDIACFFKWKEEGYVMKILECCGLHPVIGIRTLVDRSLITISNSVVLMHDLLQEMGYEIVRRESPEEPGQRSRLWLYKHIYNVFMNNTGTEQVKGIVMDSHEQKEGNLSAKAFSKLKKLRLLKLENLHFSQSLEYLSNELRFLEWDGYPFKYLPSIFQPDELVELHMHHSSIEQFWEKTQKPLQMLKVIDLRYSQNLIKTPNFRTVPNLEELNLEGCTRLRHVDQSIGVLKRLVLLNLTDCRNLVDLPSSICEVKTIKILKLSGCSKLDKLPEKLGEVTSLEKLDAGGTAIAQLPSTIDLCKKLEAISLDVCKGPRCKSRNSLFPFQLLPRKSPSPMPSMVSSLSALTCLKSLKLSNCNLMEGDIPNDLSGFSSLKELCLSGNDFETIPVSIHQLSNLAHLKLDNCKRLRTVPSLPPSICELSMDDCTSLKTFPLTSGLQCFGGSLWLSLMNCSNMINDPRNIDMALTWLKCYLHFLLVNGDQDNERPTFFTCLPGSGIPSWFNHRSVEASMRIELPPYEIWSDIKLLGFAVCAVFAGNASYHDSYIFLDAHIASKRIGFGQSWPNSSTYMSDQMLLVFFSSGYCSELLDVVDTCGPIEVAFALRPPDAIKKWGLRLVYEQDVEDFFQSNNPSQDLAFPYNFDKNEQSRDRALKPSKKVESKIRHREKNWESCARIRQNFFKVVRYRSAVPVRSTDRLYRC